MYIHAQFLNIVLTNSMFSCESIVEWLCHDVLQQNIEPTGSPVGTRNLFNDLFTKNKNPPAEVSFIATFDPVNQSIFHAFDVFGRHGFF